MRMSDVQNTWWSSLSNEEQIKVYFYCKGKKLDVSVKEVTPDIPTITIIKDHTELDKRVRNVLNVGKIPVSEYKPKPILSNESTFITNFHELS